MSIWYTEKHTPHAGITMEVRKSLYHGESDYQTLDILDTYDFGKVLLLDNVVMLTERDEFIYHEMLTHVPLFTHPDPRRVLVIGGGDGGTVREVLKHSGVREVVLVEIDPMVVEASLEHLPEISSGLTDSRVEICYEDGVQFIDRAGKNSFDVVLVDSTDPVGPAEALFSRDFFKACHRILDDKGIFASQSESPFFHLPFMIDVRRRIDGIFNQTGFYLASVTTYPSGNWSFLIGTRDTVSLPACGRKAEISTRYYTHELHLASFALPRFLKEAIEE
jgi:spermidine synthase